MRLSLRRSAALCAILLTATIAAPPARAASRETVAVSVGRLLEEGHYTRQKLNEDVSKKFLQTYLEMLDFSHLFFTQKDIDELNAKYASSMASDVLLGNLKPAYVACCVSGGATPRRNASNPPANKHPQPPNALPLKLRHPRSERSHASDGVAQDRYMRKHSCRSVEESDVLSQTS